MAQLLEFPSPMMGGRAGLHPYQARRLLRKEPQQLAACQPALDDDRPANINAVYLKNRFPEVQSDCHRCVHGSPPFCQPLQAGQLVESRPQHQ
jgi:hypothetical protein